jgi:hypothetical protein
MTAEMGDSRSRERTGIGARCGPTRTASRTFLAASLYQRGSANTATNVFMVLEGLLLLAGLVMTFKAYSRDGQQPVGGAGPQGAGLTAV